MTSSPITRGRIVWAAALASVLGTVAMLAFGPLADDRWERPGVLFALVVGAAVVGVLAATIVIAVADRRELAELGLLGCALMAAAVMPLVHGLVTPGVLYGSTEAFRMSAFLSLPLAVCAALPLCASRTTFGRWAARRWRDWTLLTLLGTFVVAAATVFYPDAVSAPGPTSPFAIGVSVAMVLVVGAWSARRLGFYELSGRSANLVASLALMLLATSGLLPLVEHPYSPAFWLLHAVGPIGVLATCGATLISCRRAVDERELLAPVLLRDPLVAFELGLSPTVQAFVRSLDRKDPTSRHHVVRTAELAIRVGESYRLSAGQLRDLGVAALLHDVGKVNIPTVILEKPDRLTPDEYEIVQRHTVDGARMLAAEPSLASAARYVRSHHERFDGAGYPDQLVGDAIPLPSRIISVCDAFDAMTHDRHHRMGLSDDMALAVLREHSGSQWDPDVVRRVIAVASTMPAEPVLVVDGDPGRARNEAAFCGCADAVPTDLADLVSAADTD